MQRVQRLILTRLPSTIVVTFWMFGSQRRLVRRLEWLTLCPNCGPFPHLSHLAMWGTPFPSDRAPVRAQMICIESDGYDTINVA